MTNLTDRLTKLAESDAPPMMIDVDRAVATGRRRRRRRQGAVLAGVAMVVATGVVAASTVVDSVSQRQPAAPPRIEAPLVTHATFGWLPPGFTRTDLTGGHHNNHAHSEIETTDYTGTHLWLTVESAGKAPEVKLAGEQLERIPAPPVNGRTAYWAFGKHPDPQYVNGGGVVLLWQAKDGRWVRLHAGSLGSDDPRAVLHRVASAVEVADRAQPLPVRITGLPAPYVLQEATFSRPMRRDQGTGAWSLQLSYTINDSTDDRRIFAIVVHPAGTMRFRYGTVKFPTKDCLTAKAVEVCVGAGENPDPKIFEPLGGIQGLLSRFVPLGLDESSWETNQKR